MQSQITREEALNLLKTYNKEPFHILHGLTVEGVMRWYAKELGYGDEEDFWGICGLLHDIDFELYPEQHCLKAPELLKEGGVGDDMITQSAPTAMESAAMWSRSMRWRRCCSPQMS